MTDRAASSPAVERLPERGALTHLPAHLRLWLAMLLALGLDLWSKHRIFADFEPRSVYAFLPGVVNFQRSMNDGAVFGSFTGQTKLFMLASLLALAFVLYLFMSSGRRQWAMQVALGLILAGALGNLYDRAYVKADVLQVRVEGQGEHTVIGTIVEEEPDGSVLIGAWPEGEALRQRFAADEIQSRRRQGVVRDFIKFVPQFPKWVPVLGGRDVWPWVFNVADAALVCGVIALLICPWSTRARDSSAPAESARSASA